jgi:hypothetical protein
MCRSGNYRIFLAFGRLILFLAKFVLKIIATVIYYTIYQTILLAIRWILLYVYLIRYRVPQGMIREIAMVYRRKIRSSYIPLILTRLFKRLFSLKF